MQGLTGPGWQAAAWSAGAMTLIVALRYLATSGAFAWATSKVRPGLYKGLEPQIRREIGWSLASAAIYGIPAGLVAWGWQQLGWTGSTRTSAPIPYGTRRCLCCCTSSRMTPGSTGPIGGCTGPGCSGEPTQSTTPAGHPRPGRP